MTNDNNAMAQFLVDACGKPFVVWQAEFDRLFPDATPADKARACDIAQKILRADAVECFATARAIEENGLE